MAIHAEPVFQFDPLTATSTAPTSGLGDVVTDKHGNRLMLVKMSGSTTTASVRGGCCGWRTSDSTGYTVTPDISASAEALALGCVLVSASVNYYQYIMIEGCPGDYISSLQTDGGISANDRLYWKTDNQWGGSITRTTALGKTRAADDTNSLLSAEAVWLTGPT